MSGSPSSEQLTEISKRLAAVSRARGGCNVLYYYSHDALSNDDAKQFARVTRGMARNKELVLILQTEGGDGAATREIVAVMQRRFKNVTAIVPGQAFSAGTLIALSCNQIIIGKEGRISQTDPVVSFEMSAKEIILAHKGHAADRQASAANLGEHLLTVLEAQYDQSRRDLAGFLENAGREPDAVKVLLHFFHDDQDKRHQFEYGYEEIKDLPFPVELLEDSPELETPIKKATDIMYEFAVRDPEEFDKHKHFFVHIAS